jgi:hypothetical protein
VLELYSAPTSGKVIQLRERVQRAQLNARVATLTGAPSSPSILTSQQTLRSFLTNSRCAPSSTTGARLTGGTAAAAAAAADFKATQQCRICAGQVAARPPLIRLMRIGTNRVAVWRRSSHSSAQSSSRQPLHTSPTASPFLLSLCRAGLSLCRAGLSLCRASLSLCRAGASHRHVRRARPNPSGTIDARTEGVWCVCSKTEQQLLGVGGWGSRRGGGRVCRAPLSTAPTCCARSAVAGAICCALAVVVVATLTPSPRRQPREPPPRPPPLSGDPPYLSLGRSETQPKRTRGSLCNLQGKCVA